MKKKSFHLLIIILIFSLSLISCSDQSANSQSSSNSSDFDFTISEFSGPTLKIVAGSEQAILEPIIQEYAIEKKQNIGIDYLGSLDIMGMLKTGQVSCGLLQVYGCLWEMTTTF